MKIKYIGLTAFAALALFASCDKLDTLPDDRATLDTEEKITKLLADAYPSQSPAYIFYYSSDDVGNNGLTYSTQPTQEEVYMFKDVASQSNDSPRSIWNAHYRAAATANAAIDAIEKMGNPTSLNPQKAEALLCRAFAMFRMATLFCMSYDANSTYPGLPYPEKFGESYNERGTVAQLYDRINADIEAALPMVDDGHLSVPKYHFNRRAAYAFAARFNLYYHKWDKAVKYATEAIGADPTPLLRKWADYADLGVDQINATYPLSGQAANLMLVNAYSLFGRSIAYSSFRRYGHNRDIMENETFWPAAPWGSGSSKTSLIFAGKLYGNNQQIRTGWISEFFEYTDKVGGTGYPHIIEPVFTADETLLVRAEAYTMLKQYDNAVADLNYWISTHCRKNTYYRTLTQQNIVTFMNSLSVAPAKPDSEKDRSIRKELHPQGFTLEADGIQEPMIQFILHVRRLETLGTGLRFLDLKRYGISYTHEVSNAEAIVFKSGDLRGAIQLPADVIQAGLPANPRESAKSSNQ